MIKLSADLNTDGMVDTKENSLFYGVPKLNDVWDKIDDDGFAQIPNNEYLARQTGMPLSIVDRLIKETNDARNSLPEDKRFLMPYPKLLRLTNKNQDPWYKRWFGPKRTGGWAARDGTSMYLYDGSENVEDPNKHVSVGFLISEGLLNPYKVNSVTKEQIDQIYKTSLAASDDNTKAETIKHEVAHANTDAGVIDPKNTITSIGPSDPLGIRTLINRYSDEAKADQERWKLYVHHSPKTHVFRDGTYFGIKPQEGWRAMNQIKLDGTALFYKKHGRLPGSDVDGNPLPKEQRVKDIKDTVRLFFDPGSNPGHNAVEWNRIVNQMKGLGVGQQFAEAWMTAKPYGSNESDMDIDLFKLANINGLVKAASMQQDTKQLDKLLKLIVNEYKKEGYDLSNMKAKFSDTPVYNNGKKVPAGVIDPNSVGGSWTNKGIVYINPNRKGPMEYYGKNVTKDPEEFSRLIMAHELAHEIYRNHADDAYKDKIRKAIKDEGFTTDYLKNGVADNKLDEEGFAEYLAHRVMNRMPDKDKLEAALDTSVSNSLIKASGKIMKVQVSNMEYAKGSLAMRCMWPRYVYMPDCEKYRNIINGSSKSAKAKLAQKFWLNLPSSVKFAACDLVVVE